MTFIELQSKTRGARKVLIITLCLIFFLPVFSISVCANEGTTDAYIVRVINENGEPVSGAMVQFCSDTECMMGKTDGNGEAAFEKEAGSYTVHILKPAEGYLKDETEYSAPDTPSLVTIVLHADETQTVQTIDVPERGVSFAISQEYLDRGLEVEYPNENVNGYPNISLYYYSPSFYQLYDEILDMDPEERTPELEEEYIQKLWATSRCLMEICLLSEEEYEALPENGEKLENICYYAPAEYLATNDGYVYVVSVPDLDDGGLTGEEASDYHACREYMNTVLKNLSFMPIEFENNDTELGNNVPPFNVQDLDGNEVNETLFKDHELTVVNIWGTFCGPCIAEMPELGEWARSMDQRTALIGIVGDVTGASDEETIALAREIVQEASADFVNLIPDESIASFLDGVIAYPTTFFVDSTGTIVGEPIVGADVDGYKAFVEDYLNQ